MIWSALLGNLQLFFRERFEINDLKRTLRFDYQNKVGFCVGSIYGVTKIVFNSADNAVVGVDTNRTSN
jgi:hypothetical protein